ncbi:MAG TPA: hypothetical protein VIJ39_15595 [Solirubrobacteraceae bacterium]
MTETPPHIDDHQRRIAELLHSFDAPAPESLHRRIESLVATHQDHRFARRSSRRRFSPLSLAGAGAATVAVVAVAIVVGLSGGGSGTPTLSVDQAAAPTLRPATLPAPAESATHQAQLAAAVDGVPFPYWGERFGWRSTGARADRIEGRTVTTIFYANGAGQRVGYAIFAGTPAPRTGGVIAWRGGVSYRLLTENGASVVTWLRNGHLCVVAGHGVSTATLLRLASWSDRTATIS